MRLNAFDARAIISYVAVCHCGLSLSAVGRHQNVARQSISRGLARADKRVRRSSLLPGRLPRRVTSNPDTITVTGRRFLSF